jgi:hypothetical protein
LQVEVPVVMAVALAILLVAEVPGVSLLPQLFFLQEALL